MSPRNGFFTKMLSSRRMNTDAKPCQSPGEDTVPDPVPLELPPPSPKQQPVQTSPLTKYIKSHSWLLATSLLQHPSNHHLVSARSAQGDLPLHMALKRSAPEDLVVLLIDIYPDATHQTGERDNSLPLHFATMYCAPPRVILTILRKYPEALDVEDEDGDTPRSLIRKGLDETSREALLKPTVYWVALLADYRKEALQSFSKRRDERVTELEQMVQDRDRLLEQAKKRERELLEHLQDLENLCAGLNSRLSEAGSDTGECVPTRQSLATKEQ